MDILKKKEPKQARSKETVDIILQSVIELVTSDETKELNTTVIAGRAGVSVGSVYQYFPSKSAIFSALIDRHMNQELEFIRDCLAKFSILPIETAVSDMVDAIFSKRKKSVVLEHSLLRFFSRFGNLDFIIQNDAQLIATVNEALELAAAKGKITKTPLSGFMMAHSIRSIFFAATLEKRELYQDGLLAAELKRLLIGYLK